MADSPTPATSTAAAAQPRALDALTFGDLLAQIAAKTPAPGGGAVASAVGALGAALGSMVVAYSLGKKALANHQPALESAARSLERARAVMIELAQEDAAAYDRYTELSRLPETDPRRAAELPTVAALCLAAPQAAAATACDLLRLLEDLAPITNRHLRSDLAIAAILAESAARSAWWNVLVNLPNLPDAAERDRIAADVQSMLEEAARRRTRIERACAS